MSSTVAKVVDFENIEKRFEDARTSREWIQMVEDFKAAKRIYAIGNGGLHFTAAHLATDCTRLIPGKVVHSLDTTGYITSNANDHGYENTFIRWLETAAIDDPKECMVVGMSCSGNSKNITRTLSWAKARGYSVGMMSGQPSKRLERGINEVAFNVNYFHTCEVLCLILFYQMVHGCGAACPSIKAEIKRKDPWAIGDE